MIHQRNKKGFTLAELLIVIAIIGVLAAISIPIFSAQLKKADAAADAANVRSAKGAAVTAYLTVNSSKTVIYYFDAEKGTVTADAAQAANIKGYGKSTEDIDDNADGIPNISGSGRIVSVAIQANGSVSCAWYGTDAGSADDSSTASDQNYAYDAEEFQSGKLYKYGDIVEKDGVQYMCVSADRTNESSFEPGLYNEGSLKSWHAIGTSDQSAVSYSISNRYAVGTLVSYNGKTYMFTPPYNDTQYSNNTPSSSSRCWTEISDSSSAVKPPVLTIPKSGVESISSAASFTNGQYYASNGTIYQYQGTTGTKTSIDYYSVKNGTWTQVSSVYQNQNAHYSKGDKIWYKGYYYTASSDFTTYSGGGFEPDKTGTSYWKTS
jgi:type IV pilus assembly protein PilA